MEESKKGGIWKRIGSAFSSMFSSKAEAEEIDDKKLQSEIEKIKKQESIGIKELEKGLEKSNESLQKAVKVTGLKERNVKEVTKKGKNREEERDER